MKQQVMVQGSEQKTEGLLPQRNILQRRATPQAEAGVAPPIVHEVLRSSGQPLAAETRAFMEPRFGHDFSRVRVHTDDKAAESARAVNARAYTVGSHVVMGRGAYAPGTSAGRRLLAHELVHVVQQSGGERLQKLSVGAVGDVYEREAEKVADHVVGTSQPRNREGGVLLYSTHPALALQSKSISTDPFIEALKGQPPNFDRAYLELFKRSMQNILDSLTWLDRATLDLWRSKYTPIHPGDDTVNRSRVSIATDAVYLRELMSLSLGDFEKDHMDELSILPIEEYSKVRSFFAARPQGLKYSASSKGIDFMIKPPHEGFCPNLYDDATLHCRRGQGNCTIAYGHLVHMGPCDGHSSETRFVNGVSREIGRKLFDNDLKNALSIVNNNVEVRLDQCQADALISFAFNANMGGMSKLLPTLNNADYHLIPDLIRNISLNGGALKNRRNNEANLFEACQY